jgi:hypothetical protein
MYCGTDIFTVRRSAGPPTVESLVVTSATVPGKVIRDYNSGHPLPAAASLAELESSTGDRYFYDAAGQRLHLKLVVQSGRDWGTLVVLA